MTPYRSTVSQYHEKECGLLHHSRAHAHTWWNELDLAAQRRRSVTQALFECLDVDRRNLGSTNLELCASHGPDHLQIAVVTADPSDKT